MKSRLKSHYGSLGTKPSKVVCQERLACRGPFPISVFYCEGCRSYQCELCEIILHEDSKFSVHQRGPLPIIPQEQLCDGDCPLNNFADVSCSTCKSKFCYYCDRQFHDRPKKNAHMRTKFENEEFLSCENGEPLEQISSSSEETMMSLSNGEDLPDLLPFSLKSDSEVCSFHLLNDKEQLQVKSSEEFAKKLQCDKSKLMKVVSIFGNTGDGKSHTLNHAFYQGHSVFQTSPAQISCTVGVWVALCPDMDIITIDTEGFLGQATNENQRARLLLKVLAISDVVIYRTRAERLHNDMFKFLGDASVAYTRHFSNELEDACARCNIDGPLSVLGPAVIIFHETSNTDVLSDGAESVLRARFQELGLRLDAFSHLEYVGVRTNRPPTDFKPLLDCVKNHVKNSSIRSARSIDVIFTVLKVLNDKFCVGLEKTMPSTFPDQYFTCPVRCLSCQARCTNSMNHSKDNVPHTCSSNCGYQYQFENKIFLCKACSDRGEKKIVSPQTTESSDASWFGLAQYAWSGYLLECPKCGIIYRSRQYWYGNKDPWETCVRTEICHVWPKESDDASQNPNTAQYVLDGFTAVSEVVSSISAKPTNFLTSWVADQVAPSYWIPNSQVLKCKCGLEFGLIEKKHHCRMCGGVFCKTCSSKTRLVPGWGSSPVRVCDLCAEEENCDKPRETPPSEVTVRKVGEAVFTTLGTMASVVNYPLGYVSGVIKDSARPTYWVPDHLLTDCCVCKKPFSPKLLIHHCRACGNGVCNNCSESRCKVPSRGWNHKVRVCDNCDKDEESGVVH